MKRLVSDRVGDGWAALGEGLWDVARARFGEAVAAEETPEAFEGLSWAAWWLDDADVVFAARERAYRLYKKSGDPVGAARMARGWLAISSTSTARLRWLAAGSVARIACSTRSSLDRTTVGLPSLRATWRTRAARWRRPLSSRAWQPSLGDSSPWPTWRCSVSLWRARRWWLAGGCGRACAISTRPPLPPWRRRPRFRSRARGPVASWSPRALPYAITSGRSNGATGSPNSRSATGAATCSRSAGRSTARCTSGGADGRTRRRCWRLRSRTSPALAQRWWVARWWRWRN